MNAKSSASAKNDGEKQQSAADRDKVKQEREMRRLAKLATKQKQQDKSRDLPNLPPADDKKPNVKPDAAPKSVKNVAKTPQMSATSAETQNSHRKSQKHGKGEEKTGKATNVPTPETVANDLNKLQIGSDSKQSTNVAVEKSEKKPLTKAERRAIQEAQRAAKAEKVPAKKETAPPKAATSAAAVVSSKPANTQSKSNELVARKPLVKKAQQHKVKLFNHLYVDISPDNLLNSSLIHPAIVRLGVQYSSGVVKGCNARGLAFMSAIKSVITEYETPSQKEFTRGLEDVIKSCGSYLQKCRPLAVSVTNAMKFIQFQLRQLPKSESDAEVGATFDDSSFFLMPNLISQ